MIKPETIEEWIKEATERPTSAPLIIQYVTNRLRDLSERNERLSADNIALMSGKRVEEYEQRIAHLEYQLEMLRRQVGGELPAGGGASPAAPAVEYSQALVYDSHGRVLRLALDAASFAPGQALATLRGGPLDPLEAPRLLAARSVEELLWVFNSGRVVSRPVSGLALAQPGPTGELDWANAPRPEEPRGGEKLACLAAISKMALADSFVQISRKGYLKKMRASLGQNILAQHNIGNGVRLPADRAFDVLLCGKEERIVLVTHQGYLLALEARSLPAAAEEVMRLGVTDYLTAAFTWPAGRPVLALTQTGKALHLAAAGIELSSSFKSRGQSLYSAQRREKGVRVVGAAAVNEGDWALALHANGLLNIHPLSDLLGAGSLAVHGEALAMVTFAGPTAPGQG